MSLELQPETADQRVKECVFRDIQQELQGLVYELVKEKLETLGLSYHKSDVYLESVPVLRSVNAMAETWVIEKDNLKRKRDFFSSVLPYFLYLETLNIDYIDDISKRFNRGHKGP
jgi:hypothetical protein